MGAVKLYFDTNVVISALVHSHEHHVPALSALVSVRNRVNKGFICAHGLAESYVLLGRALYPDFVSTTDSWRAIAESILPFLSIVGLNAKDYRDLLQRCAREGIAGGRVYDVIHIHTAMKARCDRLFTFNVRHFRQIAPPNFVDRIVLPS